MAENDPIVSAWFGVDFGGKLKGAFRECTGMGSNSEVVEYKASNPDGSYFYKRVPGRMKWNAVTLKRGITVDLGIWDWRKSVEDGKIDEARTNGSITMYNQEGKAIARWEFINAWPSKVTGPAPNANNNEVAIEEVEIVHERYQRVKV